VNRIVETILQPCLTPVKNCTLPERTTSRQDSYQSIAERRDIDLIEIIEALGVVAQSRIGEMLGVSDSTASKSLTRLVDAGKIELQKEDGKSAFSPRNFYRIKEYLQ
jgi:DNA-binding transcriptional ArsR family regulator